MRVVTGLRYPTQYNTMKPATTLHRERDVSYLHLFISRDLYPMLELYSDCIEQRVTLYMQHPPKQ